MRSFVLVIGLIGSMVLPSRASDDKQPLRALPTYFKVEIRGTMHVTKLASGAFEPLKLASQPVHATIETSGVSMRLDLGEDKELVALAKKLHGKTVLISGELHRAVDKELSGYPNLELEQRPTAGPPLANHPRLRFVDYIHVTALKTAE
jgi:hypothetical protein